MTTTSDAQDEAMARIVAEGPGGESRRRLGKRRLLAGGLAAAAAAGIFAARAAGNGTSPRFRTEPLTRGDLRVTVSATGTLQPTNEVDVGSEVSGLVEAVFVDDNDHVTSGQVLARLDVSRLRDQVVNNRAALASAEARVLQSAASVEEASANLRRLRQVAELSGGRVPSQAELEAAEAAEARAQADEASARAAVEQARASLSSAEINLAKASIRSPVDGIVLSRQIEPGQTVAASFQAPVLFTLAEDLAQMELQVDVDEADVGQVREGQSATFSVDAYPRRRYPARITRLGFGSQVRDGVVSYRAILSVDNGDLSLRPGMTATAEITTVEHAGVLLVPNAALRFRPPEPNPVAEANGFSLFPRPPGVERKEHVPDDGADEVWVLRNGTPEGVPVSVGPSDGRVTEILGGALEAGDGVITETAAEES